MSTKPPDHYSDEELLALLREERIKVTGQLMTVTSQLRQLISTMGDLETRLHEIGETEDQILKTKGEQ